MSRPLPDVLRLLSEALLALADVCEVEQPEAGASRSTPSLLSVREAARYLAVSSDTVDRLIVTGELSTVRIGRAVRVPVAELDSYIRRNETRLRPVSLQTDRRSGVGTTGAARTGGAP